MLELQTFGTVGLRSREVGESVAAILQPKRLALLVYLCLAPRRRCRRRDQVVALFWPELDQEHARGALNQALRYLRRCIGANVLVSQGEEEVGVDQTALWCDVVGFVSACENHDLETAVTLYHGPFLDSFFVADAAPEYEQWVADERRGFQNRAAQAASTLAEAADHRGELPAAVQWARRAAAISPDNEAMAARLIDLLAQSGDRVGALSTYESLRHRLQAEFRATPSSETQAIINRIRNG